MALINSCLDTLSAKQIKLLCESLENNSKSKYYLRLLNFIIEYPEANNEFLCIKVYEKINMGAFYSCKQRLLEKVKDFMCQCELVENGISEYFYPTSKNTFVEVI